MSRKFHDDPATDRLLHAVATRMRAKRGNRARKEIAAGLNVGVDTYRKWEREGPPLGAVTQIAGVLNCDPDWLLKGRDGDAGRPDDPDALLAQVADQVEDLTGQLARAIQDIADNQAALARIEGALERRGGSGDARSESLPQTPAP